LIRAAGGNPILFSAIEIVAVEDPRPLMALIDRLDEFDCAIFVSPSAVNMAMSIITARRVLPPNLKVAAIGSGGVRELRNFGLTGVIAPAVRFDSEALLELPEMRNVAGRRMVIFRGDGGREILGDTLTARGAQVEYAECYRRSRPRADPEPLLRALKGGTVHAVVVTSSEALRNLFELIGEHGRPWLKKTPLFVSHPRIEQAARALGAETVALTGQGDEELLRGITQWFAAKT
jgi:uroporphyrinogen-III synthase